MFFSFRKSGGYVHFSSKVDVLWQIWLQQQSNKGNQNLNFGCEGYQLFQFFCSRVSSICRNRPVQGGSQTLDITYLVICVFGGCKNFLIRKSKLRHWYIWVPPKVSAHQQKWARITNYKVQKSLLFFCHVKKLSVQHSSSWFFTYKITSFTKKLIHFFLV